LPKYKIDEFVASNENWITTTLALSNERLRQREKFTLTYGSLIRYRGDKYPTCARNGNQIGFDGTSFYMPPNLSEELIKATCIQIYYILAKDVLAEKVLKYCKIINVTPSAIKISGAKTRWGSCSIKKNLNFSWRLMMLSDVEIDYVVVHELAHILEMNHSKRFWSIVENILPDYRKRKSSLREFGKQLSKENWVV